MIDEALLLLSAVALVIPLVNRHFGSVLRHKVQLPRPVRALAMLALVIGLLLFAYWAMTDLLGGYNGPGYARATYPFVAAIYSAIGFNRFAVWDQQGVIGFLSFCVALLGFMTLRAWRGIGTAVKDGVALFAAPIMVVFELALWYCAPLDMYWHVTTFTSWSVGRYLTAEEFRVMMNSNLIFVWAGTVYLLSNWIVLIASCLLILISIFYRFNAADRRSYYQRRHRRRN